MEKLRVGFPSFDLRFLGLNSKLVVIVFDQVNYEKIQLILEKVIYVWLFNNRIMNRDIYIFIR